jgi:dTDP-4-amino-4,6-dideoxygalactose transaminase
LPAATARRQQILNAIRDSLGPAKRLLFRPEASAEDTSSYLLLKSESGQAFSWRERAAKSGVTLRLCWPAYQDQKPGQGSATLAWLAEHLLLVEIHAKLTQREVQRIVCCLRELDA